MLAAGGDAHPVDSGDLAQCQHDARDQDQAAVARGDGVAPLNRKRDKSKGRSPKWPIEPCFSESKGEVGPDHCELRFWPGWHHHLTLVFLAHHFLVQHQAHRAQRGGLAPCPRSVLICCRTPRCGRR